MNAPKSTALEATLKQDRAILVTGLLAVIAMSWIWLLLGAGMDMDAFEMTWLSEPVGLDTGARATPYRPCPYR